MFQIDSKLLSDFLHNSIDNTDYADDAPDTEVSFHTHNEQYNVSVGSLEYNLTGAETGEVMEMVIVLPDAIDGRIKLQVWNETTGGVLIILLFVFLYLPSCIYSYQFSRINIL